MYRGLWALDFPPLMFTSTATTVGAGAVVVAPLASLVRQLLLLNNLLCTRGQGCCHCCGSAHWRKQAPPDTWVADCSIVLAVLLVGVAGCWFIGVMQSACRACGRFETFVKRNLTVIKIPQVFFCLPTVHSSSLPHTRRLAADQILSVEVWMLQGPLIIIVTKP